MVIQFLVFSIICSFKGIKFLTLAYLIDGSLNVLVQLIIIGRFKKKKILSFLILIFFNFLFTDNKVPNGNYS